MGVEGVLVVVTRWFGGVLLGPSRFKCINNSARSLLETLPWALPRGGGGGGGGGSKGRR